MNTEPLIRRLAGALVLVGVALAVLVSAWWLLLVAFVALNLLQSSFTGFCPAESVLRRWYGARPAGPRRGAPPAAPDQPGRSTGNSVSPHRSVRETSARA